MPHWAHPTTRGVYDTPAHHPPPPMPATSNDLGSRVARLEVHSYHATIDRQRIERESLTRGQDLLGMVTALESRLRVVEAITATISTLSTWLPKLLRFIGAIILFALLLSGRMTIEGVKPFLQALGFPSG